MSGLLAPEVLAQLARFRLANRRRVQGRYAGTHRSRRHGSSLDFADYREYVAGDDPRRIDLPAYQRLGRLLVKLYEAEDEAALRVVVDRSASMGFGRKTDTANQLAAAFAALAGGAQDRIRVLLVGGQVDGTTVDVDAGPWYRGPSALPAVSARLLASVPPTVDEEDLDGPGRAHLGTALRQAHGQGPRGPVLLISDLLADDWRDAIRALAGGRGDAVLLHLLGREDLEPTLDGDLRLVDAETRSTVEVSFDDRTLTAFRARRDAWLDEVAATCGAQGVAYAMVTDDTDVGDVLLRDLRAIGLVA